jgi:hypothetical protein
MPDLSPVDEARTRGHEGRADVVAATAATHAEDMQAADGELDLAAVRLVAELEAERAS